MLVFYRYPKVHGNQVTMSVKYQVNDESLEGEKVNGIMKLYSTNGSLIHSSSFPDGFTARKRVVARTSKLPSRTLQFKV